MVFCRWYPAFDADLFFDFVDIGQVYPCHMKDCFTPSL